MALIPERLHRIVIFITWAFAQVFAFIFFGAVVSYDSMAYIDGARNILNCILPADYIAWYTSYCVLIAIVMTIGAAPVCVVMFHLVMSALATYSVYQLAFFLSKNRLSALVAAVLFATWPDIQQWNFLVYTDAPFMHMVLIVVAAIISKRSYTLIAALLLFTVFLRPVSIVFLMACIAFRTKLFYVIIAAVVLIVFTNYMMEDYADGFLESYASATIIYPDVTMGMEPPADLYMPADDALPLLKPIMFAFGNPVYFLKMSVIKGLLFIGHVKPYFSIMHNILIAIFLWPLYVLAAIGYRTLPASPLRTFIAIFIILQVVMVSVTSENWDGRFLLPVLPWVFILSSIAIPRRLHE